MNYWSRTNKRNTSLAFFFEILLLPAFRMAKCGESSMFFFFCCVFYTRQIGNYVYFIVFFFHGYFVRTVWLYIGSFIACLPRSRPIRYSTLKQKFCYQLQFSFYWMVDSRFSDFTFIFISIICSTWCLKETKVYTAPNERREIRCMIFPFTIVHLIAIRERLIFDAFIFLRFYFCFTNSKNKISPSECVVSGSSSPSSLVSISTCSCVSFRWLILTNASSQI